MDRKMISEVLNSMTHSENPLGQFLHVVIAFIAAIVVKATGLVMDNSDEYIAIGVVVLVDSLSGIYASIIKRNFETRKALKMVWYFVAYCGILTCCIVMERVYVSVFWLSEAIVMPILFFQVISILKNFKRAGLINNALFDKIISEIDKYKDVSDTAKDKPEP